MQDPSGLAKAQFVELDNSFKDPKPSGKTVSVQFNPESLKVSFANQLQQGGKGGEGQGGAKDQGTPGSQQFVGAGTTKLSLQLWFDVNAVIAPGQAPGDVRDLTKEIAYFITPKEEGKAFIPPAVRFLWGSFHFDGLMESVEESLEFFSKEGVPLRASMTIAMSQQKIVAFSGRGGGKLPSGLSAPGTVPLAAAQAGATLQGMADAAGRGGDWQKIAAANKIENPRLLAPGTLIDMNLRLG